MHSNRIGFSHWRINDDALAMKLWGNQNVTQYICASGVYTAHEIKERLRLEIMLQKQHHVQYWPIFTLDKGAFIGVCGLRPFPEEDNTFELGIHLCEEYWGKGYAFEAAKRVMDYAFREISCKRIIAGHHPQNQGSRHVLEKLDFHYIGENFYEPTGLLHPSYEYLCRSCER